jgi:hypothetical protein
VNPESNAKRILHRDSENTAHFRSNLFTQHSVFLLQSLHAELIVMVRK